MQASNLALNYLLNSLSGGVKHLHWFHNLSSFFFIFLQIKDFRQFVKTIYNIDFIIFLHFSRLRTFSNSSRRSTTPSPATCPRSSSRAVRSRSRTSPRSTWTPYWRRPSPPPPYWPTRRTPITRTFPWVFVVVLKHCTTCISILIQVQSDVKFCHLQLSYYILRIWFFFYWNSFYILTYTCMGTSKQHDNV